MAATPGKPTSYAGNVAARGARYGREPVNKECFVEGCSKSVQGRGLCAMHYRRLRLYGDPEGRPHNR
jgi:hypothetical protein